MTRGIDLETRLTETIGSFKHHPYEFVKFAYPWGEPGPLENMTGPQTWQAETLIEIGELLRAPGSNGKILKAIASGKGIGKSALVAWVAQWAMSTFPDTRGVITAGTQPQLDSKTMPEFSKWHQLSIIKHWFHNPSRSFYARDPEHEKTWRMDAIPWNETNPEAFAGLHNHGRRIIVIFDEASQIADVIWDTTDGILTDAGTEVIWLAFGNPTRSTGRFYDCANRLRHRWKFQPIDSRTVEISDKEAIQAWVDDYGEDSDYVRVNVRGLFPNVSSMQFIGRNPVAEARKREPVGHITDPLILGVDVARYGDDESVIAPRKGRDARTLPWLFYRKTDTMTLAAAVADYANRYGADAIHVDGGGVGAGVVDRLRQLGHNVREVQFGGAADRLTLDADAARYANKRSEMWGNMREALGGLALPDDQELEEQLCGPQYAFREGKRGTEILLEKKEHMKARGLPSPDRADALALTYAYPVQNKVNAGGPHSVGRGANQLVAEYDPFG